MGMSTNIQAFISPDDETYKKHAKVLLACHEAGVPLPEITREYFGNDDAELYLLEEKLEIEIPRYEWLDDEAQGFEIYVKDIPAGTYKIRFYNGW